MSGRSTLTLRNQSPKGPLKIRPSCWIDWIGEDIVICPIRGDDIAGKLIEVSVYELRLETDYGCVLVSKGNIVSGILA